MDATVEVGRSSAEATGAAAGIRLAHDTPRVDPSGEGWQRLSAEPRGGAMPASNRRRTLQRISPLADAHRSWFLCRATAYCAHDTEAAELSLRVDENNDVTCDHLWCVTSGCTSGRAKQAR